MLRVKSEKSDWLKIQNEFSAHAQKTGPSQRSEFLVLTKRSAGLSLPLLRRDEGKGGHNRIKTRKLIRLYAVFLYCFAKIWSLSSDCENCLATLSPLESNDHLQPRLQFDGQTIACASETGILLWDFRTLQMTRCVKPNPFLRSTQNPIP